ncbi:hypothetical protein [Arenivirga flava]|uniref:Uncharacterized protein n=1 Tax=Arenivirga flava TaxID=1930060 RepID=A0AA37UE47_9MICO|nr:hypothetical protein [Arenivirga flava]GMA27368.1 hypothetical protein GCM10025874_06210 [Arenivirga flava]
MTSSIPYLATVGYILVPVLVAVLAYLAIRFGVQHGVRSALADADRRRLRERLEREGDGSVGG